ncbi:hypothetical protein PLESTB_000122000 [Pleodorina starrii]|uniref:Uncharacterized protein n=1 Tax=Pleodorina starrii TaxID=330485 RepID=A0A9W6BBD0_9CHLO|nr:hypothetical protein PLESTB_000122000 [Pleodorina starrii]
MRHLPSQRTIGGATTTGGISSSRRPVVTEAGTPPHSRRLPLVPRRRRSLAPIVAAFAALLAAGLLGRCHAVALPSCDESIHLMVNGTEFAARFNGSAGCTAPDL